MRIKTIMKYLDSCACTINDIVLKYFNLYDILFNKDDNLLHVQLIFCIFNLKLKSCRIF
jgi:hypothetical protein